MNNSNRFGQVPILKKVTEDIKLLSLPYSFGMVQVNCFLFRGEKGYTVVDTGSDSEEGISTWEYLMAAGITIEKIVLTHFHIDHLGLAKWFQQKHDIPVFISSKGYQEMQRRQDKDHINYVINLFEQYGCSEFSKMASADFTHAYDFVPDGLFEENQQVQLGNGIYETISISRAFKEQIISVFISQSNRLWSWYTYVLDKISPVVLIESPYDLNPLQDYFNSMDKIKDYSIQIALPGHGKVMEGLGNRLEEIKSGHIHRMNQIVELIKV